MNRFGDKMAFCVVSFGKDSTFFNRPATFTFFSPTKLFDMFICQRRALFSATAFGREKTPVLTGYENGRDRAGFVGD